MFRKEIVIPTNITFILILVPLYLVLTLLLTFFIILGIMGFRQICSLAFIIIMIIFTQGVFVVIPTLCSNPFSIVGSMREIALMIVNEVAVVVSLALLAFYVKSLNLVDITLLSYTPSYILLILLIMIAMYVLTGRIPFDIAEAEPELASGILIELSGPLLGLYIYGNLIKRFAVSLLTSFTLLAPLLNGFNTVLVVSISLISSILIWILHTMVAVVLARSRVDLAPTTLFKIFLGLIVVSVLLRYCGL